MTTTHFHHCGWHSNRLCASVYHCTSLGAHYICVKDATKGPVCIPLVFCMLKWLFKANVKFVNAEIVALCITLPKKRIIFGGRDLWSFFLLGNIYDCSKNPRAHGGFISLLPISLRKKITSVLHSSLGWIFLPDSQRFVIEMLTNPNL